jgi:hypothetical protein
MHRKQCQGVGFRVLPLNPPCFSCPCAALLSCVLAVPASSKPGSKGTVQLPSRGREQFDCKGYDSMRTRACAQSAVLSMLVGIDTLATHCMPKAAEPSRMRPYAVNFRL